MRSHVRDCRTLSPVARDGARNVATAAMKGGRPPRPLVGARVSNRFALATISLALDEVDAASLRRRHVETKALVGPPGAARRGRVLVAVGVPRLAIPIAATQPSGPALMDECYLVVALGSSP
jgi:hypothetical protein